ncbi:MAG: CPBP family intramembrane metalloprotease [Calothrix sp. SM1_7_51]|nr:CPBP family intramembrane metalloprotease [Calothrix sp. SM1_7_51]
MVQRKISILLGQIMIPLTDVSPIATILNRILASLVIPQAKDWLIVSVALLIYAAIALPLGFWSKFLSFPKSLSVSSFFLIAFSSLITPAIIEELFFRVLLLPHPTEVLNWGRWGIWATLSLFLFIVYHPINAKTFFPSRISHIFSPCISWISCTFRDCLHYCLCFY